MALINLRAETTRFGGGAFSVFSNDGDSALITLEGRACESSMYVNAADIRAIAAMFQQAVERLDAHADEQEALAEYRAKRVMRGLEAQNEQ